VQNARKSFKLGKCDICDKHRRGGAIVTDVHVSQIATMPVLTHASTVVRTSRVVMAARRQTAVMEGREFMNMQSSRTGWHPAQRHTCKHRVVAVRRKLYEPDDLAGFGAPS
tara:strand:+ start:2872 stop:3204 length:333 start_codon:yes stop_codon:yes gene_type:complete